MIRRKAQNAVKDWIDNGKDAFDYGARQIENISDTPVFKRKRHTLY